MEVFANDSAVIGARRRRPHHLVRGRTGSRGAPALARARGPPLPVGLSGRLRLGTLREVLNADTLEHLVGNGQQMRPCSCGRRSLMRSFRGFDQFRRGVATVATPRRPTRQPNPVHRQGRLIVRQGRDAAESRLEDDPQRSRPAGHAAAGHVTAAQVRMRYCDGEGHGVEQGHLAFVKVDRHLMEALGASPLAPFPLPVCSGQGRLLYQ